MLFLQSSHMCHCTCLEIGTLLSTLLSQPLYCHALCMLLKCFNVYQCSGWFASVDRLITLCSYSTVVDCKLILQKWCFILIHSKAMVLPWELTDVCYKLVNINIVVTGAQIGTWRKNNMFYCGHYSWHLDGTFSWLDFSFC